MARAGFYLYGRDWLGGTRRLSPEARGIYADMLVLIYEGEGRCAYDEDALCAELALRSVRVLRRILGELIDAGKLIRDGNWLYNGRATREIERRRRNDSQAVDNRGQADLFAVPIQPSLAEVSPKLRPNSPDGNGQVVENAGNVLQISATLSDSDSESESESSPPSAARARPGESEGMRLGKVVRLHPPDRTRPSQGPPRLARPETVEARLLSVAIGKAGMTPEAAWSLLCAASDPRHPGHDEADRTCQQLSRRWKCGWYGPPVTGPQRRESG